MSGDRAARNANCCEHAASDHDLWGCAVDVSTDRRAYERCHLLVPADDDVRDQLIAVLWQGRKLGPESRAIADELLPVVRAYAARQLRQLACDALEAVPGAGRVHVPVTDLLDRAAALEATS